METLFNGFTLVLPAGTFPLSTDSMVLSSFVRLPRNATVLDLGSGCGTLGVLLCAKNSACHVTGIELEETAHTAALENIRRNNLQGRLHSICGDLRSKDLQIQPGSFHICVSNPPYFSAGPASPTLGSARREDSCSLSELFTAAARALRYGGDFYLVHRPERLGELCSLSSANGLEPKRLKLVRHREDGEISLVLLQCRKGGKPGLKLEELTLHHADGSPTPAYREIYHIQED